MFGDSNLTVNRMIEMFFFYSSLIILRLSIPSSFHVRTSYKIVGGLIVSARAGSCYDQTSKHTSRYFYYCCQYNLSREHHDLLSSQDDLLADEINTLINRLSRLISKN
jgi:hypothetical protein